MKTLNDYQKTVAESLADWERGLPRNILYEPVKYILSIGGKRMRPVLALMGAEVFQDDSKAAIPVALGVEIFHNFTLLHDDIMDNAPLRRGITTVHEKWNTNSAILSGDAMFVLAVQQVAKTPNNVPESLELFNKTALEVCEGQQSDMDFENRTDVNISEYIEMIRLKTAVLLGCALELGALAVNAPATEANKLYVFGENIGIAFQIMDDILDAYASEEFGKQKGGDILALKKTYLMLKAFEKGGKAVEDKMTSIVKSNLSNENKVRLVLAEFDQLKVADEARKAMDYYYSLAMDALNSVQVKETKKQPLLQLADYLYNRAI
ncbi:MAG: polyprenyl synthetase family protein [Flavobacteriales bacterium]